MAARQKYTYERLAEAAASSTSMTEVMRHLGAPLRGGSMSHVSKRLKALGIDTSHFPRGQKYSPELLAEAAASSDSVAGVLRFLGLIQAGGTHAHISRRLKALGIDTSHFRRDQGGRKRVNRLEACQVLVLDPTATKRRDPKRLRRALLEIGREYACEVCGCDGRWQGLPLTLHVDHISGDFRDNRQENLRFLCPNCHAQTPTFAGLGTGRYSRPTVLPRAIDQVV
ncbi:HNH endonuclease [Xylanimonas oleitrophica]|uniref:HNH endonuclease n=1 Tax=Xylanimonas oleitrophica TaxID=2607479 RepID=A0A2W5X406_9MICO|nr:HNH endonuclease [Xylanimonas oleitrophica]PZR55165.1 HNH endonuclease [Xylanimonas oleitrophica]